MSVARPRYKLQRILGVAFGVAVGLGAMIGSGIMRTPSLIAADVPNTMLIMALWTVGGLHAALGVNIFAELATAVPKDGGPYVYAQRGLGDTVGMLVGAADWLSYNASTAAASVSFAAFLSLLWPGASDHKALIAILLQLALYGTNMIGLREGRLVQETTSLTKVLVLFVFVGAAAAVAWVSPPQAPQVGAGAGSAIALGSIVLAYQMIIGAYSGWNGPATFSEENEDPTRSVPRALVIGLATTAIVYIAVNIGLLAALGVQGLGTSEMPFTRVLDAIGGPVPGFLFALGAIVVVASCANAAVMGGSRVIFALSRDGLLPMVLGRLNSGGSPNAAFLVGAVVSASLAASGSFELIFGLIAVLQTLGNIMVEAAFFIMRRREPNLPRPFRAWFYPWAPGLLMAIDGTLLVLFARSDRTGVVFAFSLAIVCVPLAWLARRARFGMRSAGA
jgi:APA family basic amino acid/polyamine antiporter